MLCATFLQRVPPQIRKKFIVATEFPVSCYNSGSFVMNNKILISQTVNVHNIMSIYACAKQNFMSIEHTAGTLNKKLDFYILQNMAIKIEIQKTQFYRFYFLP